MDLIDKKEVSEAFNNSISEQLSALDFKPLEDKDFDINVGNDNDKNTKGGESNNPADNLEKQPVAKPNNEQSDNGVEDKGKKVEPPNELGDILDNPKTSRDMATIRAKAKQYEREIIPKLKKEIQEKEEQLKKQNETIKQYEDFKKKSEEYELKKQEFNLQREKMQKQIEDYEKRLLLADIKSHPKYEAYVTKPKNESESKIKRLSKEYGFNYFDFIDAINETDEAEKRKKLTEIIESVHNKYDQDELLSSIKVYQRAIENERVLLESPKQTKEELELQEKLLKQKAKEKYLEAEKDLYEEHSKGQGIFVNLDEDRVNAIRNFAQKLDFEQLTEKDKVALAYGYVFTNVLREYAINANNKIKELQEENQKYKEQIKQYKSSRPKIAGNTADGASSAAIDIANMDMKEAIRHLLSSSNV